MHKISTYRHFTWDLVSEDELELFNKAFQAGILTQSDDFFRDTFCVDVNYGLSWNQQDVLEDIDAERAGWLLGFWCGQFFDEDFYDKDEDVAQEVYGNIITSLSLLASLLWAGTRDRKNDPRRAAFEEAIAEHPEGGFMVYIPKRK